MARRDDESGLIEEVIGIYYHTKVTKGGRNVSMAALVALGDGKGKIGLGYQKARGVPTAIEKASKEARKNMRKVHLVGDTVAHEVWGRHCTSRVLLRPATPGTGVKAGGTVRSVMNAAGVRNVLSKVYGGTNPINVAKATMDALVNLLSRQTVADLRGTDVRLFHPQADWKTGAPVVTDAPVAAPAEAPDAPGAEAAASAEAATVAEEPATDQ
ncbi:MAG: 30S ribosomal protein S5 [Candidatus Brocadiaceae bacterium]|nr:30S ribosomal protein S5 [Candidatus Brocadiaceae bacterium]